MIFYVDGACSGNGTDHATGGFGVIGVNNNEVEYQYSEYSTDTTNNREELKAILHVMKNFGMPPDEQWMYDEPIVYSDSAYSINTYNDWMFRWRGNEWKRANGHIPENLDLIKEYYDLYQKGYRINLQKIKGHTGDFWNEFVDKIAKGKGIEVKN